MDIWTWMRELERKLDAAFGDRLVFLGLQGSYAREEATPNSDIDAVVILDEVTMDDLDAYDAILNALPCREKTCGFVAGRREVMGWERSDLLSLCQDTIPLRGSLAFAETWFRPEDVRRTVRIGACNLYHGAVHNYLHGKSMDALAGLYKGAVFVVRMRHYARTGEYHASVSALAERCDERDREVLRTSRKLREQDASGDLRALTQQLCACASAWMEEFKED